MASKALAYDAFISYSHALDGKLAPTLQTMVERFAKPWYRPRALRVFRDNASLSASPHLWSSIEAALGSSSWLVLMASPDAATSRWVNEEITWWLKHKSADRVLVVLTAGKFAVAGEDGSPDDAALPPAMRAGLTEEPRWVDLRWLHDADQVDDSNPRLRECVADVASAIRETPKDLLVGEHIRQHRRTMRLARGAVAGLALLTVTALVAAVVAVGQRNNAVFNQILTRADQLQSIDVSLAAQLSALAYAKNPTPDAFTSLVTRGNQVRSTPLTGHTTTIRSVAYSPRGNWIATGAEDSTIRLWNPADGTTTAVLELEGPEDFTIANSLASSSDGRLLIAGITDGTIRLWDLTDLGAPRPVAEPLRSPSREPVVAVALSPDDRTIAAGNAVNELRLWDVTDTVRPVLGDIVIPGHRGVEFSADGRILAAGNLADHSIGLWNMVDSLRPAPLGVAFIGKPGEIINTVALSPDGRTLVSGGSDTYTQLWDITNPTAPAIIGSLASAGNSVTSVDFSADGSMLAIGSADALIQIVNVTNPRSPLPLDGDGPLNVPGGYVMDVAFGPDGRHLASGHFDGTLRLWDLPHHYVGSTDQVQTVQFSPDGRTLAAAGHDSQIRLWSLDGPGVSTVLRGHSDTVWNVTFSPDGRTLASASEDGTVRLWNLLDPGAAPRTILAGQVVWDATFSPDGRLLATVGEAVQLWHLDEPARATETLTGSGGLAKSVAFRPDGQALAVGYDDPVIDLWDLTRPAEPPTVLEGHRGTVTELTVSPDGRRLASASSDQTVRLWDIADTADSAPADFVLRGHTNTVYGLAFSPDGQRLASGGLDHTVRLWDLDDPGAPTSLGGPLPLGPAAGVGVGATSIVTTVAYAPDGRSLAIAGSDRTVRVWNLDPGTLMQRICTTAADNLTEQTWQQYFRDQTYEAPQCA